MLFKELALLLGNRSTLVRRVIMPKIIKDELFRTYMKQGYEFYKVKHGMASFSEVDKDFAYFLFGDDKTGLRAVKDWRSELKKEIPDEKFYAIIYLILTSQNAQLEWLTDLLLTTSAPIYTPMSPHLLAAYLAQARLHDRSLKAEEIRSVVDMFYETRDVLLQNQGYINLRVVSILGTQALSPLSPLTPLETEVREFIASSKEIKVSGLSLYRYIPTYSDAFIQALQKGLKLKILLVPHDGSAIDMMSLRSPSGRGVDEQRDLLAHAVREIERLAKLSLQVELRYLDYMPPVGITIYEDAHKDKKSICQVRLLPFRESLSDAPSFILSPNTDEKWFKYFSKQFDLMWGEGTEHIFDR
jgi:hypothetical protein